MSLKQSEQSIKHSWFGHVYRGKANAVELTEKGITFYRDQGTFLAKFGSVKEPPADVSFLWQQLDCPPKFSFSPLGYLLGFTASGKAYQVPFLSYFARKHFEDDIAHRWVIHNAQPLSDLVARVELTLSREYLRQSRLEMMQARIDREYRRWFPWCENMPLANDIKTALAKLKQMHNWNKADIEQLRENYVQAELFKFADFFEHVESNPLTDKQRRACIIDDNNNLLLAGAGTGKTSVMIGRAGYLLKSGQAQADDILLLAYGRKAADEMDERIKEKLDTNDIKASTFHRLGLRIIAQVEGKLPSLSPWAEDEKAKDRWVQGTLETLIEA
ncbi:MAG: UvrD-helicase domain-containing protein, partial [Shewanella sp.]